MWKVLLAIVILSILAQFIEPPGWFLKALLIALPVLIIALIVLVVQRSIMFALGKKPPDRHEKYIRSVFDIGVPFSGLNLQTGENCVLKKRAKIYLPANHPLEAKQKWKLLGAGKFYITTQRIIFIGSNNKKLSVEAPIVPGVSIVKRKALGRPNFSITMEDGEVYGLWMPDDMNMVSDIYKEARKRAIEAIA